MLVVIYALLCQFCLSQAYLTRPRLYLTETTIDDLIARMATSSSPLYPYYYDGVLERADDGLSDPIPSPAEFASISGSSGSRIRGYGNYLPDYVLAYLLTDDMSYRNLALNWLDALSSYPDWGTNIDLGAAHILFGFAVAFDWLEWKGQLSDPQRSTYISKLELQTSRFVDAMFTDKFWVDDYMQNHNHVDVGGMFIGAYSIEAEAGVNSTMIQLALDLAFANFDVVLEWLPPDGASQEGVAYGMYSLEAMLRYFVMEERRTGVSRMLTSDYFHYAGDFRLHHSIPPYYADIVNMADSDGEDWYGPNFILHLFSRMFDKPEYEWLVRAFTPNKEEMPGRYNIIEWRSLLWFDDSMVAPEHPGLPLVRYFDDMGIYSSRSSWRVIPYDDQSLSPEGSPETMFWMKAAPPGGHHAMYRCSGCQHTHPDEGSFILYFDGIPVIQDNGYSNWKTTFQHNAVTFTIDAIGQYGENTGWLSTDGIFEEEEGSCSILKVEEHSASEYVVADLTRMYPLWLNIQLYRRHFVWVAKKYLLLVDHIVMESPRIIKRHFHSDPNGEFHDNSWELPDENVGYFLDDLNLPEILEHTVRSSEHFDYDQNWQEYHSLLTNFTTHGLRDVVLYSLVLPYRLHSNYTRPTYRHEFLDQTGNVLTLYFDDVQITLDVPEMELIENRDRFWVTVAASIGASIGAFALIVLVIVVVVVVVCRKTNKEERDQELRG